MDVGAMANTPVCGAGDTGSIPVRPIMLRDTSSGRRPRSERGSWRFESFSLKFHAHVGQWPVRRAFTSEIAGSIPRMSTISCRLMVRHKALNLGTVVRVHAGEPFVWLAQWPSIRLKPGPSQRLDEARRTARGTDSTQVLSYRPAADAVLGFDSMARHLF